MDTLEFLQRVWPAQGTYAIMYFEPGSDKPAHKFASTIPDAEKIIKQLNTAGKNTYFTVCTFSKARRKQEFATHSKALFMDIDCGEGKPFANQREGLTWLTKYLQDTGLPMPMVISSGNGLHIYWVTTRDMTIDEWQPLADKLKASVESMGVDEGAELSGQLICQSLLMPRVCYVL